jgi:hypothetical protein
MRALEWLCITAVVGALFAFNRDSLPASLRNIVGKTAGEKESVKNIAK